MNIMTNTPSGVTSDDEMLMDQLFDAAREGDANAVNELAATVYERFIAAYEDEAPRLATNFVRVAK